MPVLGALLALFVLFNFVTAGMVLGLLKFALIIGGGRSVRLHRGHPGRQVVLVPVTLFLFDPLAHRRPR